MASLFLSDIFLSDIFSSNFFFVLRCVFVFILLWHGRRVEGVHGGRQDANGMRHGLHYGPGGNEFLKGHKSSIDAIERSRDRCHSVDVLFCSRGVSTALL